MRHAVDEATRWRTIASGTPLWQGRSEAIARWILPGESVLDIGAGACGLRHALPAGCVYLATDAYPVRVDVATVDLMTAGDDLFSGYDVAVLAGVLEHVADAERAVRLAARWAKRVVLTYSWDCDEHRPRDVEEAVSRGETTTHWRCMMAAGAEDVTFGGVRLSRVGEWYDHAVYMGEAA